MAADSVSFHHLNDLNENESQNSKGEKRDENIVSTNGIIHSSEWLKKERDIFRFKQIKFGVRHTSRFAWNLTEFLASLEIDSYLLGKPRPIRLRLHSFRRYERRYMFGRLAVQFGILYHTDFENIPAGFWFDPGDKWRIDQLADRLNVTN